MRIRTVLRRAALVCGAVVLLFLAYASTFVVSYGDLFRGRDPLVVTDVGRLSSARVDRVVEVTDVEGLRAALSDARDRGLKVSIAGRGHSQGGQTFADGVVALRMRGFDRVLDVDSAAHTVTVESGATWDDVQRALAPRGLAVKVMQSSNVFTVGGSLSANAHGRDLDLTQMVQVVESFRLMLADGSVVRASRDENPELFSLVIGGYGLYGVILDVTLRVTDDEVYRPASATVDYAELPRYFAEHVAPDPDVALMIARPSIDPDPSLFLRETVVATWRRAPAGTPADRELTHEEHVLRDRFFFGLSRRFDWGKALRWSLQKRLEPVLTDAEPVTRNNAMRPPLAPVEFLDHRSSGDSDILQEYFVPVDAFVRFMDDFRAILVGGGANVLSTTVRYVTPDATPALAYAPTDTAFAVVLLLNVGLSAEGQARAQTLTRRLVDAALDRGGTYYLTYQLYPTPEQMRRAYPGADGAFARKRAYDPDELFTSRFYERYGRARGRP